MSDGGDIANLYSLTYFLLLNVIALHGRCPYVLEMNDTDCESDLVNSESVITSWHKRIITTRIYIFIIITLKRLTIIVIINTLF